MKIYVSKSWERSVIFLTKLGHSTFNAIHNLYIPFFKIHLPKFCISQLTIYKSTGNCDFTTSINTYREKFSNIYSSPVTMMHLMLASFSSLMTGVVSGFSLFSITSRPRKFKFFSTCSLQTDILNAWIIQIYQILYSEKYLPPFCFHPFHRFTPIISRWIKTGLLSFFNKKKNRSGQKK